MKNKIIYSILVGVIIILTILNFLPRKNNALEERPQVKKHIDTISMMLETEANSGNYEMTTRESWPTDGYIFNSELSVCEHGSELSWDDENKKVLMSGNVSDKCYVYFDVYVPPTLAEYVISQYDGVQGNNNIYFHDSSLANGAGDNSYRYAGANPNNYVCFGSDATPCPTDNLYRIIGIFEDKVKLIKYDYATSALLGTDGDYYSTGTPNSSYYKGSLTTINTYYWNNSTKKNTWSESELNKTNLNTNYRTNIGTEWAQKIAMTTWKVGGNTSANINEVVPSVAYQNEIVSPVTTNTTDGATEYSAKIGLMYVSDYGFAAPQSAWTTNLTSYGDSDIYNLNWMYMGLDEWTISRYVDYSDGVFYVYRTGYVGCDDDYLPVEWVGGVRPVFSLLSSITYKSGFGTQSDPILIN